MPSRLTTNPPSSCANSLMVPRRLRLATCREDSGCPSNGSKINGLDLASTAFSSPSVNSVPTRLPSRPSRAISTASPISDSRTSGSYSVTWQRMLSNIHQLLSFGWMPRAGSTDAFWMKGPLRRFRDRGAGETVYENSVVCARVAHFHDRAIVAQRISRAEFGHGGKNSFQRRRLGGRGFQTEVLKKISHRIFRFRDAVGDQDKAVARLHLAGSALESRIGQQAHRHIAMRRTDHFSAADQQWRHMAAIYVFQF